MKFDFAIENNEIFIVKIEDFNDKFEVKRKNNEEIEEINEVKKEVQPFVLHKEESQTEPVKREVSPPESITKTKIDLIISNRAESENARYTLLKKAGLIKVEDIFYNRKVSPLSYLENYNMKEYEKLLSSELFEYTKNLEEAWVRLSNFSSDKFLDLDSKFKKEKNPLLGLKGIRFLLKYPELLRKELSAINSLNSKLSSVGVLIPMISSVYELKKVKEIIEGNLYPIFTSFALDLDWGTKENNLQKYVELKKLLNIQEGIGQERAIQYDKFKQHDKKRYKMLMDKLDDRIITLRNKNFFGKAGIASCMFMSAFYPFLSSNVSVDMTDNDYNNMLDEIKDYKFMSG